jgi:chorismate synthase
MNGNSFDKFYGITAFGESHGPAVGVVIQDVLPGLDFPFDEIQNLLDKRKPSDATSSTTRKESDQVQILSGVFEGKTTGMPICLIVYNTDARSEDYNILKELFRPGHADFTYLKKYKIYDHRGGGRASGRETIARVAASGLVSKLLGNIQINSRIVSIGHIMSADKSDYKENALYWADADNLSQVEQYLKSLQKKGDSTGAIVEVHIDNMPIGLGDPVFEKLDANLAKAILSIGGIKGIEFGDGFALTFMTGSQSNDMITKKGFTSNHMGGILGGISTGQQLVLRYAVKPTPSIKTKQQTINRRGQSAQISLEGRFDVCIAPRVIPVAEAMIKLVLADAISFQKLISNEKQSLNDYREAIDKIDEDILIALYRRFEIVKKVRDYKIQNKLPLEDKERENQLLSRLQKIGEEWGIGAEKIESIWLQIISAGKEQ